MQNTGADCDPKKRPNSEKPCQAPDCPKLVDDFVTEWSGSGSSSREVFGDINSIPISNRLPKPGQGTTRAHPSPRGRGGDPNDILGRDFFQHNHIEQTGHSHIDDGNNVQVDDFYYDYNFIKFHEDLSYDFGLSFDKDGGSESNDVRGGRRPGPEGKSDPSTVTVKNDPEERATDPPAVASHIPTAAQDHLPGASATPQSSKDEGPTTPAVLPTGGTEDRVGTPTEFQIENEEDELDSEDYFLLVSTTSTPASPVSTPSISQGWKPSNENVDLTHDHGTVHTSVPAETGPSEDVYGSRNREEPEAGLSHDAIGGISPEGIPTDEAKADYEAVGSQYEDADSLPADMTEAPVGHDHSLIGGKWVDVHDVRIHVHSPRRSDTERTDENTHGNSQGDWERLLPSKGATHDSVLFHTETNEESQAEPEPPTRAAEPTYDWQSKDLGGERLPSDKPDQNNAKESTTEEAESRRLKWVVEHTEHSDTSGPFSQDPPDPAAGQQVPSFSQAAAETPSPTNLEKDFPMPAATARSEPAANLPTHPTHLVDATSETTGPGPEEDSPHTPSSLWSEIDFNEIVIPAELRPEGTGHPATHRPTQGGDSPDPDWPPEHVDPTLPTHPDTSTFWMAGQWSAVSYPAVHSLHSPSITPV